ncbi:farnesyl pyrophosphate synthase-like [Lytechinus variegatus]|uniref:farnesyl pyrophosphate synthase-like n=1 Tax=Lytechinus variegatus TaxID=7654 RepID=UPI001BB23B09|nr:farnesyl pyrophosphate synthase-like [Lytechinus variegatus]
MQHRVPTICQRLLRATIPYYFTQVRGQTEVTQAHHPCILSSRGSHTRKASNLFLAKTCSRSDPGLGWTPVSTFKEEATEQPWYTSSDMSSATQDPQTFEKVFYELVDELTEDDAANPEIADAAAWFKEMLVYNVPGGKRNRGLTVVNAFRQLANSVQSTEDSIHIAMVLGWCVEWLQAYFLIADDMMDQSKTRRGQPCWYKKDGVGTVAINDSFYVEACIYKILKRFISHQPYYVQVMELFHETTYQTIMGQSLDLLTSPENDRDLNRFTEQRYAAIVKWKTAFYSFYLPVALAMHMVGISDAKSHNNAKTILLQMGHFFQVQDDYLDCYGAPEVIGKIGTDIEENKCGWLVVQALKRVTPDQRRILEENYGIDDAEKVMKVKELYATLDLEGVYRSYEESSYNDLMDTINSHSETLPKDIFVAFAKRIYKRNK